MASAPHPERAGSGGRRVRRLGFRSSAGRLEAALFCRIEQDPPAVAVLCHPHPRLGGTMHNKVAYRAAEAIFERGLAILRFNFRGAGRSQGTRSGGPCEEEDAQAAVGFMRDLYPNRALLLAGFSFGGGVALLVGASDAGVAGILAVTPSAGGRGFSLMAGCVKPKGVVQGTDAELCPWPDLEASYPAWSEPKALRLVRGAGHFFEDRLAELKAAVQGVLDEPAMAAALGGGAEPLADPT